MNKYEKAIVRAVRRRAKGLAGADNRHRALAGQQPRVWHQGRITHSMRTEEQGRYRR